jgi:hypothetical protein
LFNQDASADSTGKVDSPTEPTRGEDGLWRFKADGVAHEHTDAEMLKLAQMGIGADGKFREASEMRKQFEDAKPLIERQQHWEGLIGKIKGGGEDGVDAYREFAKVLGLSPEETESVIGQVQGQFQEAASSGEGSSTAAPPAQLDSKSAALLTRVGEFFKACEEQNLDPAQSLGKLDEFRRFAINQNSQGEFKTVLSKHPVIRKALQHEKRGQSIYDDLWGRFQRRVANGDAPTEETIRNVVSEYTANLDAIVGQMPASREATPPWGLGQAPGSAEGSGSRLQPPNEPKPEDFKSKQDGQVDYGAFIEAKLAFDRFNREEDSS